MFLNSFLGYGNGTFLDFTPQLESGLGNVYLTTLIFINRWILNLGNPSKTVFKMLLSTLKVGAWYIYTNNSELFSCSNVLAIFLV